METWKTVNVQDGINMGWEEITLKGGVEVCILGLSVCCIGVRWGSHG